jgi:YVTN family beta-propeller protein
MHTFTVRAARMAALLTAVTATGLAAAAQAAPAGAAPAHGAPPCSNPSDTVMAIRVATSTVRRVIKFGTGAFPDAIAVTPNGETAYVALSADSEVIPIRVATNTAGRPVKVGRGPDAIVITPDGKTVYVASSGSDTVTPISTATNRAGRAIKVGVSPGVMAITPDGRTIYTGVGAIISSPSATPYNVVIPISTVTNRPGRALRVGTDTGNSFATAQAFAFTPDSRTAYVAVGGTDEVDPIRVSTGTLGKPVRAGPGPFALAVTPNGKTAYVADSAFTVTPVSTATNNPGKPITIGTYPTALAVTPNGRTVYVATEMSSVIPVSTATNKPGKPIMVGIARGTGGSPFASVQDIAIAPDGKTAYAISDSVTPIRVATGTAGKPISSGTDLLPVTMAITPDSRTVYVGSTADCASPMPVPGMPG